MEVILHKKFKKCYVKLRPNERKRCNKRIVLFCEDPSHPQLENHQLDGNLTGYRSINVGGDLRIQYELVDDDVAHLIKLGTHSELYER